MTQDHDTSRFSGRLRLMARALFHFRAPTDPLWGVPVAERGSGHPQLWTGDQA